MPDLRFSVVIPTYNRYTLLRQCLQALQEQTYPAYEIIVVDDASSDETPHTLPKEFPTVRYIRLPQRSGPATARNVGIQTASGDIVAFTDDDCRVPPYWLETLAEAFTEHPDVVGVGGYQEAPDEILEKDIFAQAEQFMRAQRWQGRHIAPQKGGFEVPGFGTNNAAYRREVLLSVGGFDETFTSAAAEDTDLKWRICEQGYQLLYLPLKVDHYHTETVGSAWRRHIYRGIGAYDFGKKRGKAPSLVRIALRSIKRTLRLGKHLVQTDPRIAFIVYMKSMADVVGQYRAWQNDDERKFL
ncbi:hypothetical protein ARMA_0901 [Ardenticatena maritima]|uniref:Glycosyltransferase 2-like domain-containing protein n=1 Tax=Ardenticatena maritima TaxID=872965 RepID=A0A0M9UC24_9CHLR|nr:glycosyltransferase [Ardenticatena maritima]GAP62478.1 hypothetical protein ARMA_0901 [Ardenticatena maritima]